MTLRPRAGRLATRVAILAIFILLLSAAPAFATAGDGGYLDWSVVATWPGNAGSTSPHGAYATTTVKCGVCHAVHGGTLGGELLLPSPVADACAYCHMDTGTGYVQVYDSNADNYSGTDFANAHNTWEVGAITYGITCVKCHQVHAADDQMTANAFLTEKLLIGDKTYIPSPPAPDANYDPIAQAPLVGDDKPTALTKWCAGCHFVNGTGYGYYENAYNGYTHIMTTATASYSNPASSYTSRVAWADSTYCHSCHASGYGVAGAWPHYTDGMRFLESGGGASLASTAAALPEEDGVCLRCHRDTASDGIGNDF